MTSECSSPTGVGNFFINYATDIQFIDDIDCVTLKQCCVSLQNCEASAVSDVDKSYFPRAFTDIDILETNSEVSNSKIAKDTNVHADNLILPVTNSTVNAEHKDIPKANMAERLNNGSGFQPDVIVSTSHQRAGPDGSPSLMPPASRAYAPSILSETDNMFNPVRTLTFSDIDQSSHIEDSSINNSRLVSTPKKGDITKGTSLYDYSSMQSRNFYSVGGANGNQDNDGSDSSDSDDLLNGVRGNISPEFRQLEGEADNEMGNTGPFHPSAHGLSKEFMDQFVGKTSNPAYGTGNDIFSPLGANAFEVAERRMQCSTPPLHSPGPNSPYAKYANGSPGVTKSPRSPYYRQSPRSPRNRQDFNADVSSPNFNADVPSPSSRPDVRPFNREVVGNGYGASDPQSFSHGFSPSNPNTVQIRGRQTHASNVQVVKPKTHSPNSNYTFQPIGKQAPVPVPRNIPKNLNEYFEQHDKQQYYQPQPGGAYMTVDNDERQSYGFEHDDQDNDLDIQSRQGDGSDSDGDGPQRFQQTFGNHAVRNTDVHEQSHSPSPPRPVQRTQVSVKLPQATYDTISANTSHDERNAGQRFHLQQRRSPSQPPDVAITRQDDDNGGGDTSKTGQGKVDLLQNQPAGARNYDQNSHMEYNSRSNVLNNGGPIKTAQGISHKAKDFGKGNFVPSNVERNNQESFSQSGIPTASKDDEENEAYEKPFNQSVNQSSAKAPISQSQTQATQRKPVTVQVTQPSQGVGQTQSSTQISSRLLQDTASHRNKTTQKYVSNVPGISKPAAANQNKEFKKPLDVAPRNVANGTVNEGNINKKTQQTDSAPKFKVSDKTKPRSMSMETLTQKNKNQPNQSKTIDSSKTNQSENQSSRFTSSQRVNQSGEGQDRAEGEGHNLSGHSLEEMGDMGAGRIVTQVQNTSPVPVDQHEPVANMADKVDTSLDYQGMEQVRKQLQSMMRLSNAQMSPQERSKYEHSDILAGFGVEFGDQPKNYFTGDSGNVSRSDASVRAENMRLRDMVEKERYRRKHCEQYIQQLNVKLLETQQQVAVAVSTDKRKDIMIEQLDKQLARVMEGWRRRDAEKDEVVAAAERDKAQIEEKMMINNFEHDMSEAVDALRKEKETAGQEIEELKAKLHDQQRQLAHIEELLDGEREKSELLQQECEGLREGRTTLDKQLDNMQRRLHREQDEWFQREQELLQRIEEVGDKNTKILQMERAKNEEQGKLAEEIMDQYQASTTRVKKLEMELDDAHREKESLKVEMGIMEAKFENAQRVLEADLHADMEKQISEQIAEVQSRNEQTLEDLQERHRAQVLEISQRHGAELERQLARFRDELARKEDEFRKQFQELESRLEILTKLQYAMQSQWNEALSLLTATPQRQTTQSRTAGASDANTSSMSVPAVNFSLLSPRPQPANQTTESSQLANQTTPPRNQTANRNDCNKSTNDTDPKSLSANQISPVQRNPANGDYVAMFSPGKDSFVSHSTEKEPEDVSIETAALSHLRQFQDYMNSFTKTPDWISTINSQLDLSGCTSGVQREGSIQGTPRLPSPPEIAALLSTHLQNIQQQHMPQPPRSTANTTGQSVHTSQQKPANQMTGYNSAFSSQSGQSFSQYLANQLSANTSSIYSQSGSAFSQPASLSANQNQEGNSSKCSSLPPNLSSKPIKQQIPFNPTEIPPQSHQQIEVSHSNLDQTDITVYSDVTNQTGAEGSALWEEAPGLPRAVPIRPPQQGDDPYLNDDNHSVMSGVSIGPIRGYFQGGQSFSPPTRQHRDSDNNSVDDLTSQSHKLNADYSELSVRLDEHESHQNDLQHYIQMLLRRSPGEADAQHNDSLFSQDETDMNDTAQAAQLQRELDRIQELRHRQENRQGEGGAPGGGGTSVGEQH
ncbi:CNTRB-like protein, partial [Mya arenaria]